MKKTRLIAALMVLPLLASCDVMIDDPAVLDDKINLPYVEDGGLVEILPYEMYEIGCVKQETSVFLLGGAVGCEACDDAYEQVSYFAEMNHCNIYYLNLNDWTFLDDYTDTSEGDYPNTDYYWIYYASVYIDDDPEDSQFAMPTPEEAITDGIELPMLYFFKYGGVAIKTNSNFTGSLRSYVEVEQPEE